jgi:type 1 glutamine amidotransferase
VFLSTTGRDLLDSTELSALEAFLVAGGAWFGIHGAADALYSVAFYEELVGSFFASHPPGTALARVFKSSAFDHPVTAGLPDSDFAIVDEWYNFQSLPPPHSTTVLLQVDENTYLGGAHGDFHPIMWSRIVRGARSVYSAIGHTEEAFSNGCFVSLCAGAIDWLLKREPVAANTTCVSATNVTTKQTTASLPCCTTRAFPPQNQRIKVTIGYAVGFTLGALVCFLLICIAVTLRRRARKQKELETNNV